MAFSERLQKQTRTVNRVKWAGLLLAVGAGGAGIYFHRSETEVENWVLALVLPTALAMVLLGKRLKCPRCGASVQLTGKQDPPRFCRKCGADFNAEQPVSPIS